MITLKPSNTPNEWQKAQMERKYGMFIHFGINTFNNTEWSDGTLKIESYAPTGIDADGWVKNAYEAGMNYVILITKHHDGFCLFDTDTTDYSVRYSPNKTDVVLEVAKACKKYGVKLGLYYSLWDRHEKCYSDDEKYVDYMCEHIKTLLGGKYGEICELWLDGAWDKTEDRWNIPKIYDLVHTLMPMCSVAVNVTIGEEGTTETKPEYFPENYEEGMPIRYFPSDFRLLDPHFTRADDPKIYSHGGKSYYLPFEATLCIRNMSNWFWDDDYLADRLLEADFIAEKYRLLTENGNAIVVNIAPNKDGKQEPADIDRLLEASRILGIERKITD